MKKLSDYKDEEALDLLAQLIDPLTKLLEDNEFCNAVTNDNRVLALKIVLKNHKPEVMEVLAAMEGVPAEEFHCNFFEVPIRIFSVINDPFVIDFLASQDQQTSKMSSGPVMENIKETEKK